MSLGSVSLVLLLQLCVVWREEEKEEGERERETGRSGGGNNMFLIFDFIIAALVTERTQI